MVIADLFSELSLLSLLAPSPYVTALTDFGVTDDVYAIAMPHYPTSLRLWRERLGDRGEGRFALYLRVFALVVDAYTRISRRSIAHYDIKADNILLAPFTPGALREEFWDPPDDVPRFSVVWADFGEGRVLLGGESDGRSRGTEFVKAPEMLKAAAADKGGASFDRRYPFF